MTNELTMQPTAEAPSLLNIIAQTAADPTSDVAKLRALIDMQREVLAEQARVAFERDMVAVQTELPVVVRDAVNDHTRTRYARLETIDERIRPVYTRHGFSLSFDGTTQADKSIEVTCIVSHREGHSRSYKLAGELDGVGTGGKQNKTGIQAIGSTVSYLRRYLTCMIFNIVLANEDRDGGFQQPQGNITADQKDELIALMQETGADTAKFLAFMQIHSLDEMPASRFAQARGMLMKKKQGAAA